MSIVAVLKNLLGIQKQDFDYGKVTQAQITRVAYHEAGHAIAACVCDRGRLIKSISIMPKTKSGLGIVKNDEYPNFMAVATRAQLEHWIIVKLAARAAEEIVFGKENITVGCWKDIENATILALKMIAEFGFSDKIGLVYLPRAEQYPEVRIELARVLGELYERALVIVTENREALDNLAIRLVEVRELRGDEVREIYERNSLKIRSS